MATNLDYMIAGMIAFRRRAVELSGEDHLSEDSAAILKDVGGRLETFFKEHIVPILGSRVGFAQLIEALSGFGISVGDIAALHALRLDYNLAKHEPKFMLKAEVVCKHTDKAIKILNEFRGRGIATSEAQRVVPQYSRTIWLASWDHYIHGDGEINVFAPVDETEDEPPLIDLIYVNGLAWPGLLVPLGATVQSAEGSIPKKFIDAWTIGEDFAGARVFRGAYRDLLKVFSQYELRLGILSFLKREQQDVSMRTAIAFSVVDAAAKGFKVPEEVDGIIAASMVISAADYAAPQEAVLARKYSDAMAQLLKALPEGVYVPILRGPRFVGEIGFDALKVQAMALQNDVMITGDFELVVMM